MGHLRSRSGPWTCSRDQHFPSTPTQHQQLGSHKPTEKVLITWKAPKCKPLSDAWCCFWRGASQRRPLPVWTTHTPVIQEIRVWWLGSDQERQPGLFLTPTPFLHPPQYPSSVLQVTKPKACKPSSPSSLPPELLPQPVHLTPKASLEIPTATALVQATTGSHLGYFSPPQLVFTPNLPNSSPSFTLLLKWSF